MPIILTSRADGVRARIGSCAIAVLLAHARRIGDATLYRLKSEQGELRVATLHPVILVVNAGSSSVKVSVYMVPDSTHDNADIQPALAAHRQIEGIGVAPRLVARMADGRTVADESFPVELSPEGKLLTQNG